MPIPEFSILPPDYLLHSKSSNELMWKFRERCIFFMQYIPVYKYNVMYAPSFEALEVCLFISVGIQATRDVSVLQRFVWKKRIELHTDLAFAIC